MKRALVILLLSYSSIVSAEYSFNYIGVGVSAETMDFDNIDIIEDTELDGNGFGLFGSKQLGNGIFISGSYLSASPSADTEYLNSDVEVEADISSITIGGGKVFEVGEHLATLSASYSDLEIEGTLVGVGSRTETDSGFVFGASYIAPVKDNLDLLARVSRSELVDEGSTSFGIGANYNISDKVAIEGNIIDSDDSNTTFLVLKIVLD